MLSDPRELRNFLEAKRLKREPVRFEGHGKAAARFVSRKPGDFEGLMLRLKHARDWGHASEGVERLRTDLRRRHGVELPEPRSVTQNPDRSLSIFWEGVSCRFFVDGFVSLVGGMQGAIARTITTDLLDALGFLAKVQK